MPTGKPNKETYNLILNAKSKSFATGHNAVTIGGHCTISSKNVTSFSQPVLKNSVGRPPKEIVKEIIKSKRFTEDEYNSLVSAYGSWDEAIEHLISEAEIINSHQDRLKKISPTIGEGEE